MKRTLGVALAIALSTGYPGQGAADGNPKKNGATDNSEKIRSDYELTRSAQLSSVAKTQGLLADKYTLREAETKSRTRALYKLTRASWGRLWFEPKTRKKVARWLGAARRIAKRDQRELALLRTEINLANSAQETLEHAVLSNAPEIPSEASLQWPIRGRVVASFGDFKGPSRRLVMRRRGIEIKAKRGDKLVALADGRVRYLGPISGLGQGMIIDHDGYLSILGHLRAPVVNSGDLVKAGQLVAIASQTRVYLELRIAIGSLGHSVDPVPYLSKK